MASKFIYHPLSILLATLMSLVFIHWTGNNRRAIDFNAVNSLQQEIQKTKDEILTMQSRAHSTNPEFEIEKAIRNNLLMQKPEEVIIDIPKNIPSSPIHFSDQDLSLDLESDNHIINRSNEDRNKHKDDENQELSKLDNDQDFARSSSNQKIKEPKELWMDLLR